MINDDIISHIGEFLSQKDLFFAAVVDHQWYEALFLKKKRSLEATANDVKILHLCNNLCPCALEKYYQTIISDFKLKRYICSQLNEHEDAPQWIQKYFTEN